VSIPAPETTPFLSTSRKVFPRASYLLPPTSFVSLTSDTAVVAAVLSIPCELPSMLCLPAVMRAKRVCFYIPLPAGTLDIMI